MADVAGVNSKLDEAIRMPLRFAGRWWGCTGIFLRSITAQLLEGILCRLTRMAGYDFLVFSRICGII